VSPTSSSSSSSSSSPVAGTKSVLAVSLAGSGFGGGGTNAAGQRVTSLRWVLDNKKALQLFKDFLRTELSDENILFYEEVEEYRAQKAKLEASDKSKLEVAKAMEPTARKIYKSYLQQTDINSRNINIPEDVMAILLKNLRVYHENGNLPVRDRGVSDDNSYPVSSTSTVFDEPQEVIYKLMESDSLRRFVKTEEGKQAMSAAGLS